MPFRSQIYFRRRDRPIRGTNAIFGITIACSLRVYAL